MTVLELQYFGQCKIYYILAAESPSKIGRVLIKYWSFSFKIFVPLGFIKLFGGDFGLIKLF